MNIYDIFDGKKQPNQSTVTESRIEIIHEYANPLGEDMHIDSFAKLTPVSRHQGRIAGQSVIIPLGDPRKPVNNTTPVLRGIIVRRELDELEFHINPEPAFKYSIKTDDGRVITVPENNVYIDIKVTAEDTDQFSVTGLNGVAATQDSDNVASPVGSGVEEGAGPSLTIEQLATISDAALDSAYGYGRSTPGNTFGWQANLKSAAYAKKMIDSGETDIEKISNAIHRGWNVTAMAFVNNPMAFDDSKTMAPEKLQAKIAQRQKLMTQNYAQLPEDEKEKDRVVARAALQAITGEQGVAEGYVDLDGPIENTPQVVWWRKTQGGNNIYWKVFPTLSTASRARENLANSLYKKYGKNFTIGNAKFDPTQYPEQARAVDADRYMTEGIAETAPLARDARRELIAPTDRDRIRRELWKYAGSLDQEGMSNRAHAMAHSCPTWGRLYRQYHDDVSQLLSTAPTEQLAQALREIQSKFPSVAEGAVPSWLVPGKSVEYCGRVYTIQKIEGSMVQIGDRAKNRFRVPFYTLNPVGQGPKLFDEDSNMPVAVDSISPIHGESKEAIRQKIKELEEHIVKVKGGYELKSKHGDKNLGKYPTRAGAEKRERQVQYFKHANENTIASEQDVAEDQQLHIGDPVIITGAVEFKGATGDVCDFGRDRSFVVVDLYNHGKHSFHTSNVEYNKYADRDDDELDIMENYLQQLKQAGYEIL
jgi:hypothetical protein